MKGHLGPALSSMALEVWEPLVFLEEAPDELAGEIYRTLAAQFPRYRSRTGEAESRRARLEVEDRMARAIADPDDALVLLADIDADDFVSEGEAVAALSSVGELLEDYGDQLTDRYVELLRSFISRFNLRYAVDPSGALWLSWTGLASSLFHEVRDHANANAETQSRFEDFELALAECVANPRTDKIETVLSKQMNLLEASGRRHPASEQKTLGRICDELETWPHEKIREVAKSLYGFASDYPGIRHGGTYEAAKRELDLGDLAAFAAALLGLSVYLNDDIRPQVETAIVGSVSPVRRRGTVGPSGPLTGGR